MGFDELFRQELARAVEETQDDVFRFTRPNYGSSSTTETDVVSGRKGRVDAYSSTYSKTKIGGVEYYSLFFDRTGIMPGDVIIQSPISQLPPITILELEAIEECVGFRTSRIGSIYDARGLAPRFTNVRFDFYSVMAPEPGVLGPEFASPDIELRRACLWLRPTVKNGMRLRDNATGEFYQIDQVSGTSNLMILQLSVAAKR